MTSSTREELDAHVPKILHPVITFVTGEAGGDEQPIVKHTPTSRLCVASASLVAGTAVTAAMWATGHAWACPIGMAMTTGAARYLYVGVGHHASHGTVFKGREANAHLGEIISLVLVTMSHQQYRLEHAREHHNPKKLGSLEDPDLVFLTKVCGFQPGWERNRYWRHLVSNVIASPTWHFRYLAMRMRSCTPTWMRMIAMMVIQLVIAAAISGATGDISAWLVGWVAPLVVGFQTSAVLQFLCEHAWLAKPDERVTMGRFLGDPSPGTTPMLWAWWWIRLVVLHLPARVLVLVCDLPQHDLHHIRPRSDWSNPAFARRDYVRAHPGALEGVYGSLFEHIDRNFRRWSSL